MYFNLVTNSRSIVTCPNFKKVDNFVEGLFHIEFSIDRKTILSQ